MPMFETKTKRNLYILFSVSFVILIVSFIALKKKNKLSYYLKMSKDELFVSENVNFLGVFSGAPEYCFDTLQSFKHIVLRINTDRTLKVHDSLIKYISDSENVLVTIEFMGNKFFTNVKNDPLEKIVSGSYNKKLELINKTILSSNKNLFIRINPEMEVPVFKFPWQNKSGSHFIESYRYIVTKIKENYSGHKFVWAPAGFMGMEEYYPGKDVVDLISITLKSETEKLYKRYSTYSDLGDEIHRKFHRLRFFNHPVLVIGSQNLDSNRNIIFNLINNEKDTILKYQEIAYDKSLWGKSNIPSENSKFIFGLHDPNLSLTSEPAISAEHIFVDFGQVQSGELKRLLHEVVSRNHDVILTVEPWRDLSGKTDSAILNNIIAAKYDRIIQNVFSDLSKINRTVFLRFAHEMEIPITRYAWQSQDPLVYIRAFRYFMNFVHPFPPNVKRVWGPAGDRASLDFYPGDDVVDYVSFAVYGLPDKNITDHEKQISFKELFTTKLWRFRQIDKPIFITEFGVKGPEEYKATWMEDAARILNKNPQVVGVNYFNMSDTPGAWGEIKEPDWSITSETLHRFLEVLARDSP